jgi:hypothetical protein
MDGTEGVSSSESDGGPGLLRWLETIAITAIFIGLSAWHRPDDPFFLEGNFPWLALAPMLAGLRYGFFMALVSALLVLAALGLHLRLGDASGVGFPYVWAVGVLGVGLLAGEFRDYWERERQRLEASNTYQATRLEEFTRSYYLLKISHDRLEQQLAGSSNSLREALRRLYRDLDGVTRDGLSREAASVMLQVLVRYGQLQVAAIFAVREDRFDPTPLASVGRFREVDPADPLLEHALQERRLVSIQTEYRQRLEELSTDLLAVIPLIDSEDRFWGVCIIEAMPFFSFETRTLQLLNILGGHMADMAREQSGLGVSADPEWQHFRHHLARVARDAEQFQLPASILALQFEDDLEGRRVADHVQRMRRGLDVVVEHRVQGRCLILVLMPLTDELGLAGYRQRLDDALREQRGGTITDQASVLTHQIRDRGQAEAWVDGLLASPEDASDGG